MENEGTKIEDLIESEKELVLKGEEMYGEFFEHALSFNNLLNNFIKSIDDPNKFRFVAFVSQVKKHHTLALFSAVRLHHVQMDMNLRQVLEASAWAAYALGNSEEDKFAVKLPNNTLEVPQKLKEARDNWLTQNFKIKSDEIKRLKKMINESTAHSNIIYTAQNFQVHEDGKGFATPFFDFKDDYQVKTDLWFVANVAQGMLDLFYGANLQYKVFQLIDDFLPGFRILAAQNGKLKEEMMKEPRFLNAKERESR